MLSRIAGLAAALRLAPYTRVTLIENADRLGGKIRTADDGPVRSVAVHEIEIELETGDPMRLFDLAQALPRRRQRLLRPRVLRHQAPPVHVQEQ